MQRKERISKRKGQRYALLDAVRLQMLKLLVSHTDRQRSLEPLGVRATHVYSPPFICW